MCNNQIWITFTVWLFPKAHSQKLNFLWSFTDAEWWCSSRFISCSMAYYLINKKTGWGQSWSGPPGTLSRQHVPNNKTPLGGSLTFTLPFKLFWLRRLLPWFHEDWINEWSIFIQCSEHAGFTLMWFSWWAAGQILLQPTFRRDASHWPITEQLMKPWNQEDEEASASLWRWGKGGMSVTPSKGADHKIQTSGLGFNFTILLNF